MGEQRTNESGHVGEWLSGFLDGELTQQQRQRVTLHCADCEQCRNDLAELRALRERIRGGGLSEIGPDQWRESMEDTTVQVSRGIGWIIFIVGVLAAVGTVVYFLVTDSNMGAWEKIIVFGIYGGLAILLFSVLRQRLIERKTDKYKDVEI